MSEKNIESSTFGDENSIQLLTFYLDKEVFAADISQVQEVLEYENITRVPRTPEHMLGVINLRGSVVPVVDLRQQFEMTISEPSVDTCIIIVDVILDREHLPLGLLADAVQEVIVLDRNNISPPPKIGTSIDVRYILGIGRHNDEFMIILDLHKIFSDDELEQITESSVTEPEDKAQQHNEAVSESES